VNELWSYGPQAQEILTRYDSLRYRLLSYIYSLAWQVTHNGYTLMRPLVMDFRQDDTARDIGDQFMFGPALLVAPVTDPGVDTARICLPRSTWYNFWTSERISGGKFTVLPAPLETLPLLVRAGSILPLGPFLEHSSEKPADPIEHAMMRESGAGNRLQGAGNRQRKAEDRRQTCPPKPGRRQSAGEV
jgi:alpha-D-xyloside xylohydrolase